MTGGGTAAAVTEAPTQLEGRVPAGRGLLALALGGLAIGTTEFATMGVMPDIAGNLHTSIPTAGHLVSLYALGVVVGAPLFAVIGARLPRKTLLLLLMSGVGLANLASALAPTFAVLELARFVSGLPHGAYFGIGSIVAASLLPAGQRGRAVAVMMLGLTVANLVGVPASTRLGQLFGWRATYVVVAVTAAVTVAAILHWVPAAPTAAPPVRGVAMRRELGAFSRLQVWLALLTGAVGFGGFFAVYSYIAPTMTSVARFAPADIWIVLALFGLGMTVGDLVGGRLVDRSATLAIYAALGSMIAVLVTFALTVHHTLLAAFLVFLLGASGMAAVPALQTRLMDVAADAQSLAAALNHSALNVANALGAWLGGLVIAAGFGYASTAWVGVGLACGGLAVATVSVLLDQRHRT